MVEFNKWFAQITKEYPMYQDGEGYNIGNTRALMVGWRAALRMVLKRENELKPDEWDFIDVCNAIRRELEE